MAKTCVSVAICVLGSLSILLAYGCYRFGSPESFLLYLNGQRLSLQPAVVQIGPLEPGGSIDVVFSIINSGNDCARILGSKATCSCLAIVTQPSQVLPRNSAKVVVRFFGHTANPDAADASEKQQPFDIFLGTEGATGITRLTGTITLRGDD